MIWTREAFERACVGLAEALEGMEGSLSYSSWKIVHANPHGRWLIYLARRYQPQNCRHYHDDVKDNLGNGTVTSRDNSLESDATHLLHQDPDVVVVEEEEEDNTVANNGCPWEWHLSIVYSETWQTPVLYFHVQDAYSGQACTNRTEILKHLTQNPKQNAPPLDDDDDDSWDFVTQEEHPVTRMPSFFFHPCRTNERMALLRLECHNNNKEAMWLLQWMSLILPSIELALSSADFVQMSEKLQHEER
eukprot:scaffold1060_cov196-Amphora_coffeaeformis.AAC.29